MKATVLPERPISGAYRERWFDASGDCTSVLFEDDDHQEWVGIFGHGPNVEFSTAILFSTVNVAFVIAGGQGYVVDVNSGEMKYRTESDYLLGVIGVPEHDLVFARDSFALYALTSTTEIWKSDFDDYHAFRFEQATPEQVTGHLWYHGDHYPFTLRYQSWEFALGQKTTEGDVFGELAELAEAGVQEPVAAQVPITAQKPATTHFPSLTRYVKRIVIASNGAILLHTSRSQVAVWDTKTWQRRYSLNGTLVGVAVGGETFLTWHVDQDYVRKDVASLSGAYRREIGQYAEPPCTFKAWDTANGRELDMASIAPETYQLHQQSCIFADRFEPALKVKNLLGDGPSRTLSLYLDGLLENWIMTPDNQHVAAVFYISAGGFEATVGQCVDIITVKTAYEFKASSSLDSLPEIYFSAEHKLLISNHGFSFDVYDLETGSRLRHISQCDEAPHIVCGSCFAVNPHDKWQVAMSYNQEPYMLWNDDLRQKRQNWRAEQYINSVVVLNIAEVSNEGKVMHVLKQTDSIEDIAYFPNGEHLAVLLRDGSICIWHIATGRLITTLSGDDEV